MMRARLAATLLLSTVAITAQAADAAATEKKLREAVAGSHRSAENIGRNPYRHPVETLLFFGLRDDMTVVEIFPGGGGWYTEVLAPVLRERGKFYAASYDKNSPVEYFQINGKKYLDKLAANPGIYDKVVVTELEPPAKVDIAPAGTADLVVTFRNVHNWVEAGTEAAVFAAMFKALKPGGVLGLVEHRGKPDMIGKQWAEKGYVPEAEVIHMAESAGFELAGKSEINANPKDTKDYPKGVWTLPPNFAEGEKDKARYAAIGESDRMTLKFVKPN